MTRQNLITNPKAATDVSDWAAFYGGTVQRVTDWAAEGISTPTLSNGTAITTGFKVIAVLQAGTYFAYPYTNIKLSADMPYSVQMLLYAPENLSTSALYADMFNQDEWSILSHSYSETLGYAGGVYAYSAGWVTHRVFLPSNAGGENGYVQVVAQDASPFTIYFTAVMSEPGLHERLYADGDTSGWAWNLDGSSYQLGASASTLADFLDALRTALLARPGLAGVNIYTGPVGEKDIGPENIVFAVEQTAVDQEFPTAGQREAFEVYEVEGRIWIVKPGSGETTIAAARDRALALLAEVQSECSGNMTMSGSVRSLLLTSYRLEQVALDGARDCRISFTIEVKAHFTAP